MMFIDFMFKTMPKYTYGLKQKYYDNEERSTSECTRAMTILFTFLLRLFTDFNFFYYFFYIGFALAAAFWNINFSIFHLIDLLKRSKTVIKIMEAIWGPKVQLLNAIILLGLLIYWFSIIVYFYFFDHLKGAIGYNFQTTYFKIIDWTWKVI